MKKLLKSEVCGSHEQYTEPTSVAEKWLKSQIVQFKKKKKKRLKTQTPNVDTQTKHILRDYKPTIIYIISLKFSSIPTSLFTHP